MQLAQGNLSEKLLDMVSDHPWPGCSLEVLPGLKITFMSSAIISMLAAGILLVAFLVPVARKHRRLPKGPANLLEVLVVFVRDMIARPALHDRAYEHLPFLITLFVFVLALNLMGLVPLEAAAKVSGLPEMGHTATSIPTVCASLASLALLKIILSGLAVHARKCRQHSGWPMPVCCVASPVLWFGSLSPRVPGIVGKLLVVPLSLLEVIGALAKCFALTVRLCANILSGHALLAVMLLFVFQAVRSWLETRATGLFFIAPAAVLGGVAINLLELLVAGLQAYIFTFLTAMFLGLYAGQEHGRTG